MLKLCTTLYREGSINNVDSVYVYVCMNKKRKPPENTHIVCHDIET